MAHPRVAPLARQRVAVGPEVVLDADARGALEHALVGARGERAEKEAHADDREDRLQPEHNGEDVGDARQRANERLDDHAHAVVAHEQPQRAEHAQDAQRGEHLELGQHDGE